MIVVGLLVAMAFGFAAGWGWRHFDPKRKDTKGLFSELLDRYALGDLGRSSRDLEVSMLKSRLALKDTELKSVKLQLEAAQTLASCAPGAKRKPGTKNHACHDARCHGFGATGHFCHDGDCGRVPTPYTPGQGRTNTCAECGAPPGIPCWEERHKKPKKKQQGPG